MGWISREHTSTVEAALLRGWVGAPAKHPPGPSQAEVLTLGVLAKHFNYAPCVFLGACRVWEQWAQGMCTLDLGEAAADLGTSGLYKAGSAQFLCAFFRFWDLFPEPCQPCEPVSSAHFSGTFLHGNTSWKCYLPKPNGMRYSLL